MSTEEMNYLMLEKIGYLKAINFVLSNTEATQEIIDLVEKMNAQVNREYSADKLIT
jgi:hypothetical protein